MKQIIVTVKEIVPVTILRKPSALICFEETPVTIKMHPSLEGVKAGDKLFITIEKRKILDVLVDVEIVK